MSIPGVSYPDGIKLNHCASLRSVLSGQQDGNLLQNKKGALQAPFVLQGSTKRPSIQPLSN